jgi:hypothetical protein
MLGFPRDAASDLFCTYTTAENQRGERFRLFPISFYF